MVNQLLVAFFEVLGSRIVSDSDVSTAVGISALDANED